MHPGNPGQSLILYFEKAVMFAATINRARCLYFAGTKN